MRQTDYSPRKRKQQFLLLFLIYNPFQNEPANTYKNFHDLHNVVIAERK